MDSIEKASINNSPVIGRTPLSPGFYVVSTPIGNLQDITLRALDVLQGVDIICCEDKRVTQKLLTAYGIRKPLFVYNDHNGRDKRPHILGMLAEGKRVALVSDAGTPLISDPGYKLVGDILEAGYAVIPIPGVSSVLTALSVAGLATDKFYFAGFLPNKEKALRDFLRLHGERDSTTIFFESPHRLLQTLSVMYDMWGDRSLVVAREMTKLYEEFVRGTMREVMDHFKEYMARGEVVILLEGHKVEKESAKDKKEFVCEMLNDGMRVKDISKVVSQMYDLSSQHAYQEILKIKQDFDGGNVV